MIKLTEAILNWWDYSWTILRYYCSIIIIIIIIIINYLFLYRNCWVYCQQIKVINKVDFLMLLFDMLIGIQLLQVSVSLLEIIIELFDIEMKHEWEQKSTGQRLGAYLIK